ncbi:PaaI family thioesterase [Hyphomonas sp.]|uniref:PaaI family thioesterase n=1 Tax=Hyphomonas sp. TaxID=87 RepID=UPI00391A92FA
MADAAPAHRAPPEGFALTPSRGKFTLHNGPTYRATADGDPRTGMWVLDRHCNGMGFLHGGMLSAFADSGLAWAVWSATNRMSVTIKLTLEFMEIAREGDWIESHAAVTSVDGEFVQVSARIVRPNGGLIALATATFRTVRRKA